MTFAAALSRTLAAAAICGAGMSAAIAEEAREVTLRMKGGGFQVVGELKGYDGLKYVVETPQFGRLTLQAARYECIGSACTLPIATAAWSQETLSPARAETVIIRGSDVIGAELLTALIRGYAAEIGADVVHIVGTTPGVSRLRLVDKSGRELATFVVQRDEAGAALSALEKGEAAIALSDRQATAQEIDAIAAAQPKLKSAQHEHVLGQDAIAVVVAPDHPLSSLSLDQIARIFSGQLTDWYELGLPPGPIKIYAREPTAGTHARFEAQVLKPRNLAFAANVVRAASESELADTVARDRTAIALASLAQVRNAKALSLETACGLNLRPTPFGVRTGEYPLSQRLYLYAAAPPKQAAARGLLAYATSAEPALAGLEGYALGHSIEAVSLHEQSERMAHAINAQGEAFDLYAMRAMLADLKGARRLSATLRFAPGATDLDPRTRADIARLASVLLAPENATKKLIIAGFSEANGAKFQANATAAARRANLVRAALLKASGDRLDQRLLIAKGYGPLAPVACHDTPDGQRLNRRVEVWVKE
ncbi:MAG: substrate-binding domain-containing protein [Hyphomicrobiaceae bacterium]